MRAIVRGCAGVAILAIMAGCAGGGGETVALQSFPVDGTEGAITGAAFDSDVSSDGNGSIRIDAGESITIPLYTVDDIDVEDARLIYRAQLRTENLDGQAYLEMWCVFEGKGEYFSRALQAPLSGTVDWTTQETPFFLQKGENPDAVKLNLVVTGAGTVWIDDIELLKAPLE